MLELFISIPLAILIIVACHEAGRLLLRIFGIENPFESRLDDVLVKIASGFILIGFLMAFLGLTFLMRTPILWLLFIALVASAFFQGRRALATSLSGFGEPWRESRKVPFNAVLFAVVIIALAMDFLLTCVPTTAWDALTYHYPMPAIWLRAGGFIERLDICYSELPHGSEMLFGWAFALGGLNSANLGIGHLAANHVTWFAGLFSILAIISITRRFSKPVEAGSFWDSWTPGLVAAVAYLSLPIVYVEEMEGGYIENFLVFFSIVMLICLLHFKENKDGRFITVIGILAGGLLASKHTSLFLNAIVLVILVVWLAGSKQKELWKALGIAVLLALLFPLPWYIKSFMHTGDPMWPFVYQALGIGDGLPEIMYWSNPNVERSVTGFITYIPRLTLDVSLTQFSFRLLSWYFVPLIPLTIWWSVRKGNGRTIGLITWVLILLIYLLAPGEPRYMLAAWGLYAGLGAWGLFRLFARAPWVLKIVLPMLLILPIGFSLVDRTQELNNRVPTIIGAASVEDYFEKSLDIWPLVKYINEETGPADGGPADGVILVEPRIFYIQRPYIIWYPFPTPETADWNLKFDEVLDANKEHGMYKYLLLTYGPNYRALAITQGASFSFESAFFEDIPEWVCRLAYYNEPGSILNNGNFFLLLPESDERDLDFDVNSMHWIKYGALNWFGDPIISDRTGRLYDITGYPDVTQTEEDVVE